MAGLGIGTARASRPGVAAAGARAAIAAVAADGWRATTVTPVELSMAPVAASRAGFNAGGASVRRTEAVLLTKRVRRPYPDQGSLTAADVALSDCLYQSDSIAGAVNGSTETSPKPIAAWVMPSRLLVGDLAEWELVAFHRDARAGRQVACVRVRGNDGVTQTAWQTVAATVVSTLAEDAQPIEVYRGVLDVSALANGLFWLEAEVCPWIGTVASVLRSEDQTDAREFSRRYFTKDVVRAAAPPLVYVSPMGSDGAGVCSTVAATASGSPFATVQGAITGALATAGVTGGKVDGVRVRIMAGVNVWGAFNAAINRRQDSAALVIERDPDSPRASCILQQSAAVQLKLGFATSTTSSLTAPLTEAAIVIRDLTYQRIAAGQIIAGGTAVGLDVQLWNLAWDNGSLVGAWMGSAGGLRLYGVSFTNMGSFFTYSPAVAQRLHRGVTTLSNSAFEDWVQVGCRFTAKTQGTLREAAKGAIYYNNRYTGGASAAIDFQAANIGDLATGLVIVQNLVETTDAAAGPSIRVFGDNARGSSLHTIIQHNTQTGYQSVGRLNAFYDEATGTTRRTHRLARVTGNIFTQINTKGDWFFGTSAAAEAPNRTGNFAFLHGVGCQGNFEMFSAANGVAPPSSFSPLYFGLGSIPAASFTVRNDPLFVDYRAVSAAGVVGAGGGDYHLQSDSPARAIVATPVLAFDLSGVARGIGGAQAAGAFA